VCRERAYSRGRACDFIKRGGQALVVGQNATFSSRAYNVYRRVFVINSKLQLVIFHRFVVQPVGHFRRVVAVDPLPINFCP